HRVAPIAPEHIEIEPPRRGDEAPELQFAEARRDRAPADRNPPGVDFLNGRGAVVDLSAVASTSTSTER
ncbi:hypothetical protein, partial [Streptococcus pneumoniae]|uniref:hypothetical protein n=1 Tax=Streptococcus pneumoniae TaxID=1313 RepID=UPI001E51FC91